MCGFFKAFGEIDRSVQKYLEKPLLLKTPTVINKDDVITV
jgi:hypothetical protein